MECKSSPKITCITYAENLSFSLHSDFQLGQILWGQFRTVNSPIYLADYFVSWQIVFLLTTEEKIFLRKEFDLRFYSRFSVNSFKHKEKAQKHFFLNSCVFRFRVEKYLSFQESESRSSLFL